MAAGPGGRRVPDPFVIWDLLNVQEFYGKKKPSVDVHVNAMEMTVNVTRSKPTGVANDCLQKNFKGLSSDSYLV